MVISDTRPRRRRRRIARSELEQQPIKLSCGVSAEGGEIVLLQESSAGAEALKRWASRFGSDVRKGDASALTSLLEVNPASVDQLTKAGAVFELKSSPAGALVISIAAKDEESRKSIHRFLQALCGKTHVMGTSPHHPGNNLGWDAQRDDQIDK